jgi:hypothetical protein
MIAAAIFGISTAAVAEDATIRYDDAKVRTGKSAGFDTIATLKKGDKVQVLAHEGPWAKVSAGGKQGWIGINSLGDAKGKSFFAGAGELAAGASGSSSASAAGAGKGAGESEQFAQSKNLSRSGLDRMLALRNTINGSEFEKFTTEGNVGPGKK